MSAFDALPGLLSDAGKRARTLVDVPRELANMTPGLAYYLATGKTPVRAYQSLRKLFYLTDGKFHDAAHSVVRRLHPPVALDRTSGVLGDMQGARLEQVLSVIDRDGYFVFEERLSPADVEEIHAFGVSARCTPRGEGFDKDPVVFDETKKQAPTLDFLISDIVRCAPLRRLLADRSILALTQAYLRSSVVLECPRMWWSTPGDGQASSVAAQLYHVDLDRVRWLNFSFLINDVDTTNGPHCFVRGSHRNKPAELLHDGRYSDEEIAAHYPNDMVEIGGPRGTIFVSDNRAFHKGKNLQRGSRLLFQMVVADSLFGQTYEQVPVPADAGADLGEAARKWPSTYRNFLMSGA
jgi:hypothetical protein